MRQTAEQFVQIDEITIARDMAGGNGYVLIVCSLTRASARGRVRRRVHNARVDITNDVGTVAWIVCLF